MFFSYVLSFLQSTTAKNNLRIRICFCGQIESANASLSLHHTGRTVSPYPTETPRGFPLSGTRRIAFARDDLSFEKILKPAACLRYALFVRDSSRIGCRERERTPPRDTRGSTAGLLRIIGQIYGDAGGGERRGGEAGERVPAVTTRLVRAKIRRVFERKRERGGYAVITAR